MPAFINVVGSARQLARLPHRPPRPHARAHAGMANERLARMGLGTHSPTIPPGAGPGGIEEGRGMEGRGVIGVCRTSLRNAEFL
jgi:hypothetical protein